MNYKLVTALSVLTVAVLAGCNNAKSPGAVTNDVAAAQQKAAENVADVRKDASKDNVSATDKVDDKSKDLNNVEAKGAHDVCHPQILSGATAGAKKYSWCRPPSTALAYAATSSRKRCSGSGIEVVM